MKIRIRPIHILLALSLLLTSCARFCGQMAYTNHIDAQTERFTYETTTAADLWNETRTLLSEYGHSVPDTHAPPVEETYLTPWSGEPGARNRLSIRILRAGRLGHRVQIHEISEYEEEIYPPGYDPHDPNAAPLDPSQIRTEIRTRRQRQLSYEWELIQRADPEASLLIEGEALRRRDTTQEVVANGCQ